MFSGLFKKTNKALVGIDISSSSVKILELSQTAGVYRVEAFAIQPLPPGAVVEQSINSEEAVADAIQKAISRSRTVAKTAAIAVTGSAVITKIVQMNSDLSPDDMDYQIRAEADQYIPYPIEEVALDWEIQGDTEDKSGTLDVLLAACRSETVERRKDSVEISGLDVTKVDVEAFCLERAFSLLDLDAVETNSATVAIMDIGSTISTLSIIDEGQAIYTREQLFGGRQLLEDVMRRYGLSEDEARLAQTQGTLPDDYEYELLQPFRQAVVQQLTRSLQLFYSSSKYNDVDMVVLAGGVSAIDGLTDMIEDALTVPCQIANPFSRMTISQRVNASLLADSASALMIAAGLAMRGFD